MASFARSWGRALCLVAFAAASYAACGGDASVTGFGTNDASGAGQGGAGGKGASGSGGDIFETGAGGTAQTGFQVTPTDPQTITVQAGQMSPTVTFSATLNGQPVNAGWSLTKGEIGSIPQTASPSGVFTPTGQVGGLVKINAALTVGGMSMTEARQVFVKLTATQNGPNGSPAEKNQIAADVPSLKAGGGIGGVGGEGLGVAVDAATLAALGMPADDGAAQKLRVIYPYDKTVWARGLLAPLVMWDWSAGDADAIQLRLASKSGSFSWTGTFGRPAILAKTGGKFVRHPIPQDVWEQATNSAGAMPDNTPDTLTLQLVVASKGVAHGPITQTWIVAPARLSGIIYYNSYGTQLAQNYGGALGGNGKFGGAVLSIHVGDVAPKLTAGSSGGIAQCKVCHSVAAGGTRLVLQHGDNYDASSSFDLSSMGASETNMATNAEWFPGVTPDGSKALSRAAKLIPLPNGAAPLPTTGLLTVATALGTPAFSPDGKLVAFNPMAGPGVKSPAQELLVMSFDSATNTFANPTVVVDDGGQPAEKRPGWPAFFPDGKSIVFHHQSVAGYDGNGDGAMWTRRGAKARIAWTAVDNAQKVTVLGQLNGLDGNGQSYLPKLAQAMAMSCTGDGSQVGAIDADHGDDVDLNYEPTVNPIASGGYAWVVFTSRRMYGSVATIPPFCSDPRGVDLLQNITPKKLWVAAIDLSGAPGADASHPAFYLPAQELLAGNSRGYWVLDPCKQDGAPCKTGDECCGGFCEPNGDKGALICDKKSSTGMCSQPQEKCTTNAECCDPTNLCVNGFCAPTGPK